MNVFPELDLDEFKFRFIPSMPIFTFFFFFFFLFSFFSLLLIAMNSRSLYSLDHFWQDMQNRRWLFEAFANREGFDSNVASHWYSCSRDLFVHKVSQHYLTSSQLFSLSLSSSCSLPSFFMLLLTKFEVDARSTAALLWKYC